MATFSLGRAFLPYTGNPSFRSRENQGNDISVWTYPGGEVGVQIYTDQTDDSLLAKIRSSTDIMALLQIASVMEKKENLILPYFPYARQDRVTGSMPFALGCIVDLIDGLGFKNVWCADPHSPVLGARWRNTKFNVIELQSLEAEIGVAVHHANKEGNKMMFMAPDAGAIKRVASYADRFNLPMTNAWKVRDPNTGKLTLSIKKEQIPDDMKSIIVIDDICDGGATFESLARAVKDINPRIALDLVVSHGIFSGSAVSKLSGYRMVVTTDSFHDSETYDGLRVKFADNGTHLRICNIF
jgi:ribose-phosphate pyrophosphokinase